MILPVAAALCAAGPTVPGIDVAADQGTLDWAKVRESRIGPAPGPPA